jgi:hypothetical protein
LSNQRNPITNRLYSPSMSHKKKQASGIYQYLDSSGVLENGTPDEIAEVRREYLNMVKRQSMKRKRSIETEVKVFFSDVELISINKAATLYHLSRTKYVKEAALAYSKQAYLVADESVTNEIKHLLYQNRTAIEDVVQESTEKDITYKLFDLIEKLEKTIMQYVTNPVLLEKALAKIISEHPEYAAQLQSIIEKPTQLDY